MRHGALLEAEAVQPVVVGEVSVRGDAERPPGPPGQVSQALGIRWVIVAELLRDGSLGQVVDTAPAGPPDAHGLAGVQQPLGGDLDLRAVPPRARA